VEAITSIAGLDLGQAQDFSALAVLGQQIGDGPTAYAVRHLQRWPPGTAYLRIAADEGRLLQAPELADCPLAVDQTGVGRPVVDLLRRAKVDACLHPVTITAGH
jgi:hypothetical protein